MTPQPTPTRFDVPRRDDVSPANQALFDALSSRLGKVPNLYATFAHSEHALATYLALQNAPSSLDFRAREVVNLVVSQVNGCEYCLAAHTVLAGRAGFTPAQILAIRRGRVDGDPKLDALAVLARDIAVARGHADVANTEAFFAAGWTRENLVDAVVAIGDKIVTNYLHAVTQVQIDFPLAPAL